MLILCLLLAFSHWQLAIGFFYISLLRSRIWGQKVATATLGTKISLSEWGEYSAITPKTIWCQKVVAATLGTKNNEGLYLIVLPFVALFGLAAADAAFSRQRLLVVSLHY